MASGPIIYHCYRHKRTAQIVHVNYLAEYGEEGDGREAADRAMDQMFKEFPQAWDHLDEMVPSPTFEITC